MNEIVNKHVPSKMLKSKHKLPYITRSIEKLIRKRNRIYARRKNMQRTLEHSTHNYNILDHNHKALKKDIQQKLRNVHWSYAEDIITPLKNENDKSGLKKIQSYIKKMRRDYLGIVSLKYNGKMVTDHKEKADVPNKQFESVFVMERPIEPAMQKVSTFPDMDDIVISTLGVSKLPEKLKSYKASGPMKQLEENIAPILTMIYQKSYETGQIPMDWKSAEVTPVFKKGGKTAACNYRPISLTCIACKIMEHILTSHIMKHASKN